jgi:hypothetical protein
MTKYEQMLPQEQRKQMKLLGRGTVPTIIIKGAEQKASTRAWLLGRAVPPTTCREMGGSFTVTLSQTQNILPKQEPKESHGKENMMRSAKPKSSYLKTISNLENLENFPKNQKSGLIDEKSSSKISNKIASMKKLFEKNTEKSESSASMSICGGPMGGKQYRQKNCAAQQHGSVD